MRGSEIIREKKEFEELLAKNEKKRKAMSSKYIDLSITKDKNIDHKKEIMEKINELKKEINKRKTIEWKPEPLLCRKFNVLDPYEHKPFYKEELSKPKHTLKDFVKDTVMKGGKSEMQEIRGDGNDFFKEVQASFLGEEQQQPEDIKPEEEAQEETQEQLIISIENRPEMSLFQSIFDD